VAKDELKQQNEKLLVTGDALERRVEACTAELRTSNAQLEQKIAELEGAEAAVEERLRFEILLSRLSTRFLNLPPGEVDRQIEHGLQHLAQFWRWIAAPCSSSRKTRPICARPTRGRFRDVNPPRH